MTLLEVWNTKKRFDYGGYYATAISISNPTKVYYVGKPNHAMAFVQVYLVGDLDMKLPIYCNIGDSVSDLEQKLLRQWS